MDSVLNDSVNLVIHEDMGLTSLRLLKEASYRKKTIEVYSSEKKDSERNNLYTFGLFDKINDINKCSSVVFIFSLNPKLESAVINARLRTRYRNSPLTLVSSGQYFDFNMPINFINLDTSKTLTTFEGKTSLSRVIIHSESSLLLLGNSICRRGLDPVTLAKHLKCYLNHFKVIKINEISNLESSLFLNFKTLNTKKNDSSKSVCINLDDTLN